MATPAFTGDPSNTPVNMSASANGGRSDESRKGNGSSTKELGSGSFEEPLAEKPRPPPGPMDPASFPDGGRAAWLTVAGGWCCAFVTFGWINAIGVFQEYYESELLPTYDSSTISWIVSLQPFITLLGAPIVGRTYDNFGPRYLLAGGTFMHVFGLMMLSLGSQYYQLLLAQGFCSSIGCSMILFPAMNTTVSWFFKKRALALGILVSGSSVGGVIFPIMLQRLLPQVGFGWAVRAAAFVILGLGSFAAFATTSRLPPSNKPWSPMDFIRPYAEPAFAAICAAFFFGQLGLYIPFNFITISALEVGTDAYLASYLLAIMNAASIIGRIAPGYVADKAGKFNVQIVMCVLWMIVVLAIWLPARGPAPIIVFAVLYGIASGAFLSLAPALVAAVTTDMRQIGVRTGSMYFVGSIGSLVGNPIAGALRDRDNGGFTYVAVFTGLTTFFCVSLYVYGKSLCKGKFFKIY